MKRILASLAVLCLTVANLGARPQPQKSGPLTTPFRPPLNTVLVDKGRPRAVVLVPEDGAYARQARAFVARFERAAGVRLPSRPEADAIGKRSDMPTLVVFGNAATGPLTLRLYANKQIGADSVYPGAGGFELRTIPFALDTGVNVLFLGGSSPESVGKAADAFFARLKPARDIAIPHAIKWVCPTMSPPGPVSGADIEKAVARARKTLAAFRSNAYRAVCSQFSRAAASYYLSGDDTYGCLCARLVDVLARHYAKGKEKPPTFDMHNVAMALDQVDESASMTDADRLKAAEWLRRLAEDTMAFWEMRVPIRKYMRNELSPIWNHETHPAVSIAHCAQYLRTRYDVKAAEYWEAVIDHLFAGQITCDQPLEDSANYQWSVARHTIAYVLATGRLREYFTNEALRDCMEYAIASHDSQGNEATHGDAWQPFGSTAGPLFSLTATLHKDPRHQWILSRVGSAAPRMWSYPIRIEAKPPTDHVGLRVFRVHPDRAKAYGVEGVPAGRVLDKAVFRSGWEPGADYLMLDGLNVGNHKHLDANAIIRFSTQRRYWLVDMDYIRAAPKHHNSISVVRNGLAPNQMPASRGDAQVIAEQPFAAELVHSAGTRTSGITQSLLANYGGLDWRRSVFWKAKDFFVVIDKLRARVEGDYVVRCHWRTLGQATLDGGTLHVTQRGEHHTGNRSFRVIDDDGRRVVEFLTRKARIVFERDLTSGTYRVNLVAKGISGGADSLWLRVDGGTRLAYHLPIGKYGGSSATYEKMSPGPAVKIAKAGSHRFEITLRESQGSVWTRWCSRLPPAVSRSSKPRTW